MARQIIALQLIMFSNSDQIESPIHSCHLATLPLCRLAQLAQLAHYCSLFRLSYCTHAIPTLLQEQQPLKIMQDQFLARLFQIQPFKLVESPESLKRSHSALQQPNSHHKLSAQDQLILSKAKTTTEKPSQYVEFKTGQTMANKCDSKQQCIVESSVFSNLSESIDNLFCKIEKIKEEFEVPSRPMKRITPVKEALADNTNIQIPMSICSSIAKSARTQPGKVGIKSHKQNNQLEIYARPVCSFDLKAEDNYKIGRVGKEELGSKVFSMSEFELGKCVGSGKFGDVHICRHKQTGFVVALKKIFKSTIKEYRMMEQFAKEIKIHYSLNHPHVTKLYGHFEDEYHIFLLMEYAEEGTLPACKQVSEERASRIILQVLEGVEYLHRNSITHRDLKPENIVLSNGSVKICDFGWSSFCDDGMRKTFCGTLDYISPEMKDKGVYSSSIDLWSIGVLTYELLTGNPPYRYQIDQWRVKGSKLSDKWDWDVIYPPELSEYAKDFIQGLLREDPSVRASIKECKSHFFIKKYAGSGSCIDFKI